MKQMNKQVWRWTEPIKDCKTLEEVINSEAFKKIFYQVLRNSKKYNEEYYKEIFNKIKDNKELSEEEKSDFFNLLKDEKVYKIAERIYNNIDRKKYPLKEIVKMLEEILGYINIEKEIDIDWKKFKIVSESGKQWEIKYGLIKSWEEDKEDKLKEKCIFDEIWEVTEIENKVYYAARTDNIWYIVEYWKESDPLKQEIEVEVRYFFGNKAKLIAKPDDLWRIWQSLFIFDRKSEEGKIGEFKKIGKNVLYDDGNRYYAWMKWDGKWTIVKTWEESRWSGSSTERIVYYKEMGDKVILKSRIDWVMLVFKLNKQWEIKHGAIKSWEEDKEGKLEEKCVFDEIWRIEKLNGDIYVTWSIGDKVWWIKYWDEKKTSENCKFDRAWLGQDCCWTAFCVFGLGDKVWRIKYWDEKKAEEKCIFDEIIEHKEINWELYYVWRIWDKYGVIRYWEEDKAEEKCIFEKIKEVKEINWELYYVWKIGDKYGVIRYWEEDKIKEKSIFDEIKEVKEENWEVFYAWRIGDKIWWIKYWEEDKAKKKVIFDSITEVKEKNWEVFYAWTIGNTWYIIKYWDEKK